MKYLLSFFMMFLFSNAQATETTADLLFDRLVELATNKDIKTSNGDEITQMELNELVTFVKTNNLRAKDLFPVYAKAMQFASELPTEEFSGMQRHSLKKAIGMIFSVRTSMDNYELNPNWECRWYPLPNPLDALPADSPQKSPDRFKFADDRDKMVFFGDPDANTIVAKCGTHRSFANEPNY